LAFGPVEAPDAAAAQVTAQAKIQGWKGDCSFKNAKQISDSSASAAYGKSNEQTNIESTTSDPVGESGGIGPQGKGSRAQNEPSQGGQEAGDGTQGANRGNDEGGNRGTEQDLAQTPPEEQSDSGRLAQADGSGGEVSPWLLRHPGFALVRRVLENNDVEVTTKEAETTVIPGEDGSITLNIHPGEFKAGDVHFAAMLNEEFKHAAQAIAQRKQWLADKKSGKTKDDFRTWVRKDAKSIWNDLLTRLDPLEGKQQTVKRVSSPILTTATFA